jgi:hypothetical protein
MIDGMMKNFSSEFVSDFVRINDFWSTQSRNNHLLGVFPFLNRPRTHEITGWSPLTILNRFFSSEIILSHNSSYRRLKEYIGSKEGRSNACDTTMKWQAHLKAWTINVKMVVFQCPASCVTIPNTESLFSSETGVNSGMRSWKMHLSDRARYQKAIGGIYFTRKWKEENLHF